jgi:hypothetical protein
MASGVANGATVDKAVKQLIITANNNIRGEMGYSGVNVNTVDGKVF